MNQNNDKKIGSSRPANGAPKRTNAPKNAPFGKTAEKKSDEIIKTRKRKPVKKDDKNAPKERSILSKVLSTIATVILTILLICFITGVIVVGAFAIYIKNYIDPVIEDFDMISTEQKLSSKIYYMDYEDRVNRVGTPVELEDERLYGSENRIWVSYDDIPEYLREAFISIEDERFWEHNGVDWKRTLGATYYFVTGTDSYGGSTITQQLVKNLTGDKEIRIQRKLEEIMRAMYLDKTKDKTEILELYLNTIYLSQGCYGVQAAANTYFDKDVSELSLVECAALASITQAPTKWDPIQNPENNKERRDVVLMKMYELGKINYSQYQEALNTELELANRRDEIPGEPSTDEENYNTWYTDAVIRSVVSRLMDERGYPENLAYNMIYSGGLKIYTVMDPDIQAALDKVYVENTAVFQDHVLPGIIKPESSMVIIHPTTGDVLGIAGGRGKKQGNLVLNYATQTTRSPGSSIKPLTVYAPALEAGVITYGSVYDDVPVNFDTGKYIDNGASITYYYPETGQTLIRNTGWPGNLPTVYDGLCNINYAVQVSKNTVAVRVLQDLTCEASFDFAKNKLHMDSMIERRQISNGDWISDKGLAALALGEMNYGVTNLEITAAYSIFTNKGVYNAPRLYTQVLDSDDNVIIGDIERSEDDVVLTEQNAYIMTKMLKGVVDYGTAYSVGLKHQVNVAGKTGTTNSDHDRWFIGFTPYLLGGVWYGYAEPDSLSKVDGNPASNIWNEVMTIAHQKYFEEDAANGRARKTFEEVSGIYVQTVCRDSGKLMTQACLADPRGPRGMTGYYTAGSVPREACDVHVLVEYDTVKKAVANDGCPEKDVKKVGLLNIPSRNFPRQLRVTDAEFTMRKMGDKVEPCNNEKLPYYANELKGKFSGISGFNAVQYNRACYDHFKEPYVETTTEAPTESLPPTTDETTKPKPDTTASGGNPTGTVAPGSKPPEPETTAPTETTGPNEETTG